MKEYIKCDSYSQFDMKRISNHTLVIIKGFMSEIRVAKLWVFFRLKTQPFAKSYFFFEKTKTLTHIQTYHCLLADLLNERYYSF